MRKLLIFIGILVCLDAMAAPRGAATTRTQSARTATTTRAAITPARQRTVSSRAATRQIMPTVPTRNIVMRAATTTTPQTQTGAEYEQCKNAYFSCMDQFCALKNDSFKRCSCSDRIFTLQDNQRVMQEANVQLTEFKESLDSVGMTASQAAAMKTTSEGEDALAADKSASKALLNAIMNSIRGEDASVGGKYDALNAVNMTMDSANAFGMNDSGLAMASLNGEKLYGAIYAQCKNMVQPDCNNASLSRAVNAYLMAIEQDCNTLNSVNQNMQKQLTVAVREGGAMLDLARVENRQKLNQYDMTTCIKNVETAVQSIEVCGPNYQKCLDNGQFIDVSTGAPIVGVADFYKLEKTLQFVDGKSLDEQKLSKIPGNQTFVKQFETRVKKFAQPELDKCTESADVVWADFLDRAMLDIYYAQKAKVADIKQGCFEFITACYKNTDAQLSAPMIDLIGDPGLILQPDKITVNSEICNKYTAACNGMFSGGEDNGIINEYANYRKKVDVIDACRSATQQCFDKFGGEAFEGFYRLGSGLFNPGEALRWFSLYEVGTGKYSSRCAQLVGEITSCKEHMVEVFGGFDAKDEIHRFTFGLTEYEEWKEDKMRPKGVATEVYNQIVNILSIECDNLRGKFLQKTLMPEDMYRLATDGVGGMCVLNASSQDNPYYPLWRAYGFLTNENMCPRDYSRRVDTESWGICSCWENGARRSNNSTSEVCVETIPKTVNGVAQWSSVNIRMNTALDQVCPYLGLGATDNVNNNLCVVGPNISDDTRQVIPVGTNATR